MTEKQKGEAIISLEILLWSLFPVLTVLTYAHVPALIALAWCSLFAGLFFGVIVVVRRRWADFYNPTFWKYISGVIAVTGVLYYVLYFLGLEHTSPGNAAIIALSEVLAAYLFFNVYYGEDFSRGHVVGSLLMVVGAFIVVGKGWQGVNMGDIFVLAASFIAPLGNLFQRELRKIAASESILFVRSVAASAAIFLLAALLGKGASSAQVIQALPFLLVNGILLLGLSKFLWVEAIHRLPVTKCNALNSAAPFLTLLFAWSLLGQAPDGWQLGALVPLFIGVLLLMDQVRLPRYR